MSIDGAALAVGGASELGTDSEDPRLKRTDQVAGVAVCADLVVGISNEANKERLRQELRRAPIQMKIDAAMIVLASASRRVQNFSTACERQHA